MIAPISLLPGALGVQWGWTPGQCLRALAPAARRVDYWVEVTLPEPAASSVAELHFLDGRLHHIRCWLRRERSPAVNSWDYFWKRRAFEAQTVYAGYRETAARYASALGAPRFSGENYVEEGTTGIHSREALTCWQHPEGQIELWYRSGSEKSPEGSGVLYLEVWETGDPQAWRPRVERKPVPADPETGDLPLFDPRRILPGALGVTWGRPQEECLRGVRGGVVETTRAWSLVELADSEVPDAVTLLFHGGGGLSGISVHLFESRDFWDADWDSEEMNAVDEEYFGHFIRVEQFLTELLGPPDFRGDGETEEFEEAGLGPAEEVAFWDHPEARIQLEFSHEDKELPFCVDLHLIPPSRLPDGRQ